MKYLNSNSKNKKFNRISALKIQKSYKDKTSNCRPKLLKWVIIWPNFSMLLMTTEVQNFWTISRAQSDSLSRKTEKLIICIIIIAKNERVYYQKFIQFLKRWGRHTDLFNFFYGFLTLATEGYPFVSNKSLTLRSILPTGD